MMIDRAMNDITAPRVRGPAALVGPVVVVDEVERALVGRDIVEALTEQGVLPSPAQVRTVTTIPRTPRGKAG